MLRATSKISLGRTHIGIRRLVSTSRTRSNQPNPPLHLDPSLRALLQDVDISLGNYNPKGTKLHQLEVVSNLQSSDVVDEDVESVRRKSPAALFGSQGIGAVILPDQLQASINLIISESDKIQLHSDAKRLFQSEMGNPNSESKWEAQYDVRYHSRIQAARHYERDGTAFASIALPAHYSAIYAVLDHVKRRLEPSWGIQHVIDWGAGTGSGLWASSYSFQEQPAQDTAAGDLSIDKSTLLTYRGIDKRDGLVSIGKKLLRNTQTGELKVSWHRSFQGGDILDLNGRDTLALSAFLLTTLPTPLARKALIKEMWESGAHVIVLIDHNTPAGFEAIAQAREYLLKLGRAEPEGSEEVQIRGSHVVAPCPHDAACPLHHPGSGKLVCGFAQRLQRPAFIRRTKHSGIGHEDIEYSYVVIRRGIRPTNATTTLGRIGEVGRRALEDEARSSAPVKELRLHNEESASLPHQPVQVPDISQSSETLSPAELNEVLRQEAYQWPRLIFPPIKKSGHIILDSCTSAGKIMRMTIPKSQGKQPYYDARKSSWGDIFPHSPKNPPQERALPVKKSKNDPPMPGSDIGKRRDSSRGKEPITYEGLTSGPKEQRDSRKKSRRGRP
ncbi:Rsm22-domain-containing protein [Pluteus cervinus]|uniref:Rsm22-domain-containing protein n=1 Tax=Pluteus cervinus TaxID=181527 RepID=A0ACD3BIG3_9AGAR|nr:Rsm22-domain-containing protein [Pluteus cervinus]